MVWECLEWECLVWECLVWACLEWACLMVFKVAWICQELEDSLVSVTNKNNLECQVMCQVVWDSRIVLVLNNHNSNKTKKISLVRSNKEWWEWIMFNMEIWVRWIKCKWGRWIKCKCKWHKIKWKKEWDKWEWDKWEWDKWEWDKWEWDKWEWVVKLIMRMMKIKNQCF